jgi:hypothetical protein
VGWVTSREVLVLHPPPFFLHASEMRERRGLAPSLARIRDEGEAGLGPLLGTRPR